MCTFVALTHTRAFTFTHKCKCWVIESRSIRDLTERETHERRQEILCCFGDTVHSDPYMRERRGEGGHMACAYICVFVSISFFWVCVCAVPCHVVPVHSCIRFYLCICACEVLLIQKVLISRNSDSNYIIYINPCVYVWESAEGRLLRCCAIYTQHTLTMVDRSLSRTIICVYTYLL